MASQQEKLSVGTLHSTMRSNDEASMTFARGLSMAPRGINMPKENAVIAADLGHLAVMLVCHQAETSDPAEGFRFPAPEEAKRSRDRLMAKPESKFQKAMGVFPV